MQQQPGERIALHRAQSDACACVYMGRRRRRRRRGWVAGGAGWAAWAAAGAAVGAAGAALPEGLAGLLERPCRVYARVFTLDDYTDEVERLAEGLLEAACRQTGGAGVGFPGALLPRPCEELEKFRGALAEGRGPQRGDTLALVRALAHEACQFRAFQASLLNGRRAEGEAENLVRRAVTAMAQIQVEQGLTSLSADPDDNRSNFRAATAAEVALDGENARVPEPPLPTRAQAGEVRSVPLRETFAGLLKGAEQLSDTEVQAAVQGIEHRALTALYESLEGAGWARRKGWEEAYANKALLRGGGYCDWHGVECQEPASGVRRLILPGNNLRGRLPGAVGTLRHLQVLDLARNALRGPVPAELGLLPGLSALDLQDNLLHGTLPATLSELHELRLFDVSSNRLEGPLPPLPLASQLALFNVSGNEGLAVEFPGWLLDAGALEALSMSGAGVRGSLPTGLAALRRLRLLDLSHNSLEGSIPAEIFALNSLQVLDLSRNRFNGDLSEAFPDYSFRALETGGEGDSGATGGGAEQGGEEGAGPAPGGGLVVCSLASNRLSGSLPRRLPRGLLVLNVADNRLSGYHPDAVLQLGKLRHLNLSRNVIEGPLPGWPHGISRLGSLQTLDASHNRLAGGLPEDVGGLTELQVLRLNGNALSGSLPDGITRLEGLRELVLGNNALAGVLPADLHRLAGSLRTLDLANNSLSGPAPYQLVGGRLMERVDLSGNALTWSP